MSPQHAGTVDNANARGRDASFVCGSFVEFSMRIEPDSKVVAIAAYETNGCGFMIAAADVLAEYVEGRTLSELHGLDEAELCRLIHQNLGEIGENRGHCSECCTSALRAAFAGYRTKQIEQFRGENALVCTCFGVSEERIDSLIAYRVVVSFEAISRITNAGSGCGSCRMLIEEMLDSHGRDSVL